MEAALDELEADDAITVVILTGAGSTFCAGADLKRVAKGKGDELATKKGGFGGIVTREFPKPLIAAVNGPALAGGFEIVLTCDLVVAADHAMFGLPEAKRGLFAAAGGLIRLPKRIPLAIATEIAITGDPIDAATGARARSRQPGGPGRRGDRTAHSSSPPASPSTGRSRCATRSRWCARRRDLTEEEAWPRNYELAIEVFSSKDSIEGATAFAEKREPRWTGT